MQIATLLSQKANLYKLSDVCDYEMGLGLVIFL